MNYELIIFALFSGIATCAAFLVIAMNNPIRCALALVVAFFASAGLWLMLYAEFLALVLVLVYVGAVMTFFLFVIMMLNVELASMRKPMKRHIPIALIILSLFVFLILMVVAPESLGLAHLQNAQALTADASNAKALGLVLYTTYAYAFEIAGVLLLVAIIASVVLAHRSPKKIKTQDPVAQMMVKAEDRVRLVKGN